MKICAVFGHRKADYAPFKEKIRLKMIELIENEGVTQFYSGGRGDFDIICTRIVYELKREYPELKNILVLSYHPAKAFELPQIYDESVYLLERKVPPLYAIIETNKALVDVADFVISGVSRDWGGAYEAITYAKQKHKAIIEICQYE